MIRYCSSSTWLLLLVAVALLVGGCGHKGPPKGVNGIIDLSAWDFETDGTVKLNGEWEFYWQQLLTPQDFQRRERIPPTGFATVPGGWDRVRVEGSPLPRDGYATYRLQVKLKDGDPKGIRIRYLCTAYRLWVDDALVAANGVVGTSREAMVPQFLPATAYFTPRSDTVQLVVQVSNFRHRCAGFGNTPLLGTAGQVGRQAERGSAVAMFLGGAILIMAFYHLALYLLRRADRSPLYFGLFCLIIGVRMLVTGELFLIRLFPGFNWEAELRIEYLTGYLGLPVFGLFLRSLYPQEMSVRVVRIAQAIGLLGCLTLLAPARISSLFLPPYQAIFLLFLSIYAVNVLARAAWRKRDGAGLFLAGGAVFFGALINDVLNWSLVITTGYILPVGLFVLILTESVVLAKRFAGAFSELQRSRRLLTEREEHLRREIAEMLHGPVQTRLLMAGQRMGVAERLRETDPGQAWELVAAAREEVERVREEDVRQASHLLHPSFIQVGLVPAVHLLAERIEDRFQVSIEVDPRLEEMEATVENSLPGPVRLAAYRVLEEALNNVCAHAGASRVEIFLGIAPERRLHIRVRDDGQGLDSGRLEPGLGLRSIAARVGEMGGTWEVSGQPGQGTTLSAWLPLEGA